MIQRLLDLPGRAKVLIILGILLLVAAVTGVMQARNDIDLTREEAIEIGEEYIDFEPTNADARLIRQGFALKPVWAVSFSIPEEGNPREFVRLTTVEINAETGEVIRISVDDGTST